MRALKLLYQLGLCHELPVEAQIVSFDILEVSLSLGIIGDDHEIASDVLSVVKVSDMDDIVSVVLVVNVLDGKIVYTELVDPFSEKIAQLLVLQFCICAVVRDLGEELFRGIGGAQVPLVEIKSDVSHFTFSLYGTDDHILNPVKSDVVHDEKEAYLVDQVA